MNDVREAGIIALFSLVDMTLFIISRSCDRDYLIIIMNLRIKLPTLICH